MRYLILNNISGLSDFQFVVKNFVHERSENFSDIHAHRDFFELVVVKSGSGTHWTEKKSENLSAGDIFLIPPGVEHNYPIAKSLSIYNVLFSDGFFQQFRDDLSAFANYQLYFNLSSTANSGAVEIMHLDRNSFAELIKLLEETVDEQKTPGPGSQTAVLCNALKIMLLLCRHAKSRTSDELSGAVFSISRLLAEMENTLDEKWNLEKMAKKCCLSVSSFRQQFKHFTGVSPAAWLLEARIRKAQTLLKTSDLSVSEISAICGFSDSNYFARQYKKHLSLSPREYRKESF